MEKRFGMPVDCIIKSALPACVSRSFASRLIIARRARGLSDDEQPTIVDCSECAEVLQDEPET